jgi:hypothetical protein
MLRFEQKWINDDEEEGDASKNQTLSGPLADSALLDLGRRRGEELGPHHGRGEKAGQEDSP